MLLLFVTTSCSTYKIPDSIDEIPDIGPTETEVVTLPPITVGPEVVVNSIKLPIVSLTGFTEAQATRFKKIVANVEVVINTQEFKEMVLNFTYNKKMAFVDNGGFTNAQILEKVLSKDWPIEYKLESMRSYTVGYTYPSVTWIAINKKNFNDYDDGDIACNILHEMGGHKIGRFDHAQKWSQSRDYSVPYGIGYGGEKIYRKMFMTK